jgi:hypothetical protein
MNLLSPLFQKEGIILSPISMIEDVMSLKSQTSVSALTEASFRLIGIVEKLLATHTNNQAALASAKTEIAQLLEEKTANQARVDEFVAADEQANADIESLRTAWEQLAEKALAAIPAEQASE